MKKNLVLLLFLLVVLNSCERDDICIDDITPKFVISFFDNDDPEAIKNVNNIKVQIIGIDLNEDGELDEYTDNNLTIKPATDSIEVPLKVNEGIIQFILTSNNLSDTERNADTLTVAYDTEDIFVGRSCGFKSTFKNVQYEAINNDNWIQRLEVVSTIIENKSEDETRAHLKIFH